MSELRRILGESKVEADGLTLEWNPGRLDVAFDTGRHHVVRYRLREGHFLFRATVASARQLRVLAEESGQRYSRLRKRICREIVLQNQHTESVCFRLDKNDRLEGVIAQREATLHRVELVYYASQLAREADRFEALLNERDRW